MDRTDIAVLTHEGDELFEKTNYLIHALVDAWRTTGLRVTILRGTGLFVPARLLIPHIDATIRPAEYETFLRRYPRVANRRVTDVSKSAISENLVRPDASYEGPVIVKTNRNYGGLPERRLGITQSRRSLAEGIRSHWAARSGAAPSGVPWERVEWLPTGSYPVFEKLRDVPPGVFGNAGLVVEKYVAEMQDGMYCVRFNYAVGQREITLRLKSRQPVIKGSNASTCEEAESPPELGPLRRRLGLDYGKIDFVVRNGKPVLIDINPTPAAATLKRYRLTRQIARDLAPGIAELLDASESGGP